MTSSLPLASSATITILNRALADAAWARARLSPHAGAIVRIRTAVVELDFGIDTEGRLAAVTNAAPPTLTLEVDLGRLPVEWIQGGIDRVSHAVRVEGNAELADALGFVLRNLEWDPEEALSRVTGDVMAHRAGLALRKASREITRSVRRTTDNLAEYLAHDAEVLVARGELDARRDILVRLRDDLARLDKRITRLTRA